MMRTTKKTRGLSARSVNLLIASLLLAAFLIVVKSMHVVSGPNKDATYGIALGSSVRYWSQDKLDNNFKLIKDLGVTSIRFDISWSALQPRNANDYEWNTYDRIIDTAKKYNLSSLVILDYTPRWARQVKCINSEMCPPKSNEAFATYSAQVVRRYYPKGVTVYEIWNEPNLDIFWQPKANASEYSSLLMAASKSIHSQERNAIVLSGGLSPAGDPNEAIAPRTFLESLYQSGAKDYFDGVAYHPYTFPVTIQNDLAVNWKLMGDSSPNMRGIMARYNDSAKKIWITEYGAPTNGPGLGASGNVQNTNYGYVDEALQATMAKQTIDYVGSNDWVASYYWYTLLDGGTDTDNKENFFGLIDTYGRLKPAYTQIKDSLSGQDKK